jgi:hypothetical protein
LTCSIAEAGIIGALVYVNITFLSCVTWDADTGEPSVCVLTCGGSIERAGVRVTGLNPTGLTYEPIRAVTVEQAVGQVIAHGTILTRIVDAAVNVQLAHFPSVSHCTCAGEVKVVVHAHPTIEAHSPPAVVHRLLTPPSCPSIWAEALKSSERFLQAEPSIHARHLHALVDVNPATPSCEPGQACALITTDNIRAGASILTGIGCTLIHLSLTVSAGEPRRTGTGIVID